MDDNNDNVFEQVATGLTTTARTQSSLTEGNTYQFRVRARNAVGFSPYSTVFSILAATVPSKPASPTTTLSGDSTQVVIDWTAPADSGGITI